MDEEKLQIDKVKLKELITILNEASSNLKTESKIKLFGNLAQVYCLIKETLNSEQQFSNPFKFIEVENNAEGLDIINNFVIDLIVTGLEFPKWYIKLKNDKNKLKIIQEFVLNNLIPADSQIIEKSNFQIISSESQEYIFNLAIVLSNIDRELNNNDQIALISEITNIYKILVTLKPILNHIEFSSEDESENFKSFSISKCKSSKEELLLRVNALLRFCGIKRSVEDTIELKIKIVQNFIIENILNYLKIGLPSE